MKFTDTITEIILMPNGTWSFKGSCKAKDLREGKNGSELPKQAKD